MTPCIGPLHVSAEHPADRSALPNSSHHLAHFGRAQAILRSGTAAGKVTVTVSCEGCEDETIDIVVEPKSYSIL